MKKILSVIISLAVCLCFFSSALPSFALSSGDFTYEIVDGYAVITSYVGSGTTVTVPAEIDGTAVLKIGDNAFSGNTEITSVTVSEGVADIGAGAFCNCTALATISLPKTVTHVGENAIYNTAYYNDTSNWRLKTVGGGSSSGGVNIGNGNTSIDWEDIGAPVLEYLYLDKVLIKIELEGSYSIKYGTLVIADGAFEGNTGATDVGLPTSIVSIGCNAFAGCEKLTSLRNLKYVKIIGDNAFYGCSSLESITLSSTVAVKSNAFLGTGYYNNAENWENGVLYLNGTVLAACPDNGDVCLNDSATRIIEGAVENARIFIPATVTDIHENAIIDKENSVIFGYSNTTAQAYATLYSIKFVDVENPLMGDVDLDGTVSAADLQILYDVCGLKNEITIGVRLAGDLNSDGAIDGIDAIVLDLILNEMEPSKIRGDINGDRVVDSADYDLLCQIASTTAKITDNYMLNRSDLNGDGAVDGLDAVELDLILKGYII